MRRLLQVCTVIMILVTVLTPLSEALDRWDAPGWDVPGLSNDTEFAIFALVLFLALVLLLSKLVALRNQIVRLVECPALFGGSEECAQWSGPALFSSINPDTSPPLRI